MIGLGVQFTLLEEDVDAIVGDQEILYGAYFIITAGCAVIVLAVFGILGALCDYKINRILLFLVRALFMSPFCYIAIRINIQHFTCIYIRAVEPL